MLMKNLKEFQSISIMPWMRSFNSGAFEIHVSQDLP